MGLELFAFANKWSSNESINLRSYVCRNSLIISFDISDHLRRLIDGRFFSKSSVKNIQNGKKPIQKKIAQK